MVNEGLYMYVTLRCSLSITEILSAHHKFTKIIGCGSLILILTYSDLSHQSGCQAGKWNHPNNYVR